MKKIVVFFVSLISYGISYSQYEAQTFSFMRDDFGGWKFTEQLIEVIELARLNEISKLEIDIVEIRNSETDYTKFKCDIKPNNNLLVEKIYEGSERIYVSGYEYNIIKGVFCLKSTFSVSHPFLPKNNYIDLHSGNNNYPFDSTFIQVNSDTSILTVIRKYREIDYITGDTILLREIHKSDVRYYFDLNNNIIKVNGRNGNELDRFYSYISNDTIICNYSVNQSGTEVKYAEKQILSKKWISKKKYIKIITIYFSDSFFSKTKNEYINSTRKHTDKLEYTLNKQKLPVEIYLLDSKSLAKTGSSMRIKYFK